MTSKTVQLVCPTCGEVTTHALETDGEVTSAGLRMHMNLSGTRRPSVGYKNSPHRSGGSAMVPQGIVVHYTAGSYDGAVSWFQDPVSRVSAHFVVARDGRRVQMVPLPDPDTVGPRDGKYQAWHCKGGNSVYFGIEHEYGYPGATGPADWTEEMLDSSAELSAYLCDLYDIPIEVPLDPGTRGWVKGLGGHYNVPGNDHTDPGPYFPWDYYIDRVRDHSRRLLEAPPSFAFAPSGTQATGASAPASPAYQTL
ncbi:peptidoglycan recognition family protein [Streptomyces sp. NPDC086122]|uniref:N-acetylmuramoyl-L-alanine amidase n=1 Tax=Streptomyces sp. NPDC086122 TaxID=3155294 RepID=UPI00344A9066